MEPSAFTAMAARFDGQVGAFAYLLMILLYMPCVAAVGAIYQEVGWRWTLFGACWTTGLGWLAAVLFLPGHAVRSCPRHGHVVDRAVSRRPGSSDSTPASRRSYGRPAPSGQARNRGVTTRSRRDPAMTTLFAVKRYMQDHGRVTVADLATNLETTPDHVRGLLEMWRAKQRVRLIPGSCGELRQGIVRRLQLRRCRSAT